MNPVISMPRIATDEDSPADSIAATTTSDGTTTVSNEELALNFESMATLLEQQGADPWRTHAYHEGASTLLKLAESAQSVYIDKGVPGLIAIPSIGKSLAAAIVEILQTGHWAQLERLRGQLDPIALFTRIPGIGADLAERIVDKLSIDNLEGLEAAAHDGRLTSVPGIGTKRLEAVKASLAQRLRLRPKHLPTAVAGHSQQRNTKRPAANVQQHPFVYQLLDVDAEYRGKADARALKLIAPKRFNPENIAWLPILHTRRGVWHFTALYSNTQRAHALGKTHDWVVIYFHSDQHLEGQFTVVTETHGPQTGKRVIRGLESACADFYH